MEELATADWWSADESAEAVSALEFVAKNLVTAETALPASNSDEVDAAEEIHSAAIIGLALAAFTGANSVARKEDEE